MACRSFPHGHSAFWQLRVSVVGVGAALSAWTKGTDLLIDPEVAGNCTRLINDYENMPGDPCANVTMVEVRSPLQLHPCSRTPWVAPSCDVRAMSAEGLQVALRQKVPVTPGATCCGCS